MFPHLLGEELCGEMEGHNAKNPRARTSLKTPLHSQNSVCYTEELPQLLKLSEIT